MKKTKLIHIFLVGISLLITAGPAAADVIINILAVNGTDTVKEKKIEQLLPKELKLDDILDPAGLEIKYDVDTGSYAVVGSVQLEPKESKTLRIRVKDVWLINRPDIQAIKDQIESNFQRVVGTEFAESAAIKKESLLKRLDYIVSQQEVNADNAGKRIDRYRVNEKEMNEIRNNAVSIKYWRSRPPSPEEANIFRLILQAENPSLDKAITKEQVHYLPKEVKPEHILETADFEVKYDALKGQSFLWKEEELQPGERKRYEISIIDIWNIKQPNIENLRDRTRSTFLFLENTQYADSAQFLVSSIKKNLESIESSQGQEKDIAQHIMDYRSNIEFYGQATKDVEALEELLEVVREKLVRSRLENVLEKVRSLKNVSDISKAIFENNSLLNEGGKTILGVIIGIGIIIVIAFFYFLSKSKDVVIEESEENIAEKEEAKV
ncbi:MAG: hypothetical protein AB7S78_14045 [Candidatus Omnitrophota bacterium]